MHTVYASKCSELSAERGVCVCVQAASVVVPPLLVLGECRIIFVTEERFPAEGVDALAVSATE